MLVVDQPLHLEPMTPCTASDAATGPGLVAWTVAVYALLGIGAGRVPVLARLSVLERRRVVFGPGFAGIARQAGGRARSPSPRLCR